jgi:hypothetical protein
MVYAFMYMSSEIALWRSYQGIRTLIVLCGVVFRLFVHPYISIKEL